MKNDEQPVGDEAHRSQMPESVYRDAVTKLRILLEATEAASYAAAEAEHEDLDATKLRQTLKMRHDAAEMRQKVNFLGSVDRNIHRVREDRDGRGGEVGFQSADRKNHRFVKNKNIKLGGVRRALFTNDDKEEEAQNDRRYNSWHNLVYQDTERSEVTTNEMSTGLPAGELRSLIEKQESYIAQLEKETRFCREQLAKVLAQVKESWPSGGNPSEDVAVKSLKTFQKMMGEYASIAHAEDVQRLKLENAMLRQKLESFDPASVTSALVEKLKRDNAILLQTLNQVREESEENVRREAEAVEQVKRSVQVAEQARMEKHELEFEIEQLKMQIDRQQVRIRGLIEEQDSKIDEERSVVERRAQEQLRQVREEAEVQAGEVGRLLAELERSERLELELRRQLKDRERVVEDLQQETEKRVGQIQLEIVSLNTTRQQLEHEVGCLRLDLDGSRQELRSERGRHETEVDSLRGRLKRTEEQLVNAREETLALAESKAGFEREANLLKIQVQHLQQASQQADSRLLQANNALSSSAVKEEKLNNERFVEAKLRDLVQRQSRLITELKRQCLMVADKLESTSTSAQKEILQLQMEVERLTDERRRSSEEVISLQSQNKEFGRVYEKSIRRLESLEVEHKRACDEIERLRRDLQILSREKTLLEQELAMFRRRNSTVENRSVKSRHIENRNVENRHVDSRHHDIEISPDRILSQAIVIERNGQLSSPFVNGSIPAARANT